MKTNKSYKKRIKVTKNGKLVSRRPGQNHYNAKESSSEKMKKHRTQHIHMTKKSKDRFLNNV